MDQEGSDITTGLPHQIYLVLQLLDHITIKHTLRTAQRCSNHVIFDKRNIGLYIKSEAYKNEAN